jgi:glycosyltransferase involved in cell wall biosynthesis
MYFAVDATLWEDYSPDGYDLMAGAILSGLESVGHRCTYLGKARIVAPASLPWGAHWIRAEAKSGEWIFPDGWRTRSVPRTMAEGHMDRWISWTGTDLPARKHEFQWVFLKDAGKLLWPGHEGLSRAQLKTFKSRWETLLENRGAGIIVFSESVKAILKNSFGVAEERLRVLPAFYDLGLAPPAWEDRENAKWGYNDGKEYFLWMGTLDPEAHWMEILKAFSLFKTRQKSQMRLLLAPWKITDADFQERLSTYKFRADVKVLEPGHDVWKRVIRGAYALLYTPRVDALGWVPGLALSLGIPLIGAEMSVAREWTGDTVAWVDPGSPEAIAGAMIRLYKDEDYRARIQAEGITLAGDRAGALHQYEQVFSLPLADI